MVSPPETVPPAEHVWKPPGLVYTFYSYKGGVGRSMALANVAALLARYGRKVLVIDWDLEAPGLERFFMNAPSRIVKGSRAETPGLLDLVEGIVTGAAVDWRSCLLKARPFGDEWELSILHAGLDNHEYVGRLQQIDWQKIFIENNFGQALERMRQEWTSEYDFIFVDSRTGITDIGGICTVHLPDILVLLFTTSEQSLRGVIDVMDRARRARGNLPFDRGKLIALPVPARDESHTEHEKAMAWRERFASDLAALYAEWLPPGKRIDEVLAKMSVAYKAFWSFGERLPVAEESVIDPKGPAASYQLLADLLNQGLAWDSANADTPEMLRDREARALAQQAEAYYAASPPEGQAAARRVFLRLIRVGRPEETEPFGRQRVNVGEIDAAARSVLDELVQAGFVQIEETPDGRLAQLSNDHLLKHWVRLHQWLDEDREFMWWRQKLRVQSADWYRSARAKERLLRGSELVEARQWSSRAPLELAPLESAFVAVSAQRARTRLIRQVTTAAVLVALVVIIATLFLSGNAPSAAPGTVLDEARSAGVQAGALAEATEDYFREMDSGIPLSPDEIAGRNTWMTWTGGNDRFWDQLATLTGSSLDLLKTISSHPQLPFNRDTRWSNLGLVNEPCFDRPSGPDPNRYGLWLDARRDCPLDPFADGTKYPGVRVGARGNGRDVGSLFGEATGVVGLRLFPNPAFDAAAARRWDPVRYYTDANYYQDKTLVRPYRVGVACAFCHVGQNPINPPPDPGHPAWRHLSATVGAQYLRPDRVFSWAQTPNSFISQLLHTARPGTLDASLIATDSINNPRAINPLYELGSRLMLARRSGREQVAGGGLNNRQLNDYVASGPLAGLFEAPSTVFTPRFLLDGSDSAGVLSGINHWYAISGVFSEETRLHFRPFVGGSAVTPFEISAARRNSSYWNATEARTAHVVEFLLKATSAHRLKDAPGGPSFLVAPQSQLVEGKLMFADRCASCHSSKSPSVVPAADVGRCETTSYLDCWNRYWAVTKTSEYRQQMRAIVTAPDFLVGNLLSNDLRVPVTLLDTNVCSALASNGVGGALWDNFSSRTYKTLPPVGSITVYHPVTGEPRSFEMPGGGRGYVRTPSLVAIWASAPYLHNNALGSFAPDPSVPSRMRSFEDGIEKLLWPDRRPRDPVARSATAGGGSIDRTTAVTFLDVPAELVPASLRGPGGAIQTLATRLGLFTERSLRIGPIPAGTPVNLLANLALDQGGSQPDRGDHMARVVAVLTTLQRDLETADEGTRAARFANVVDTLLALSACPDFVIDRGHYFGTDLFKEEPGLTDAQKRALIEFLKTL
jgi:cellulose biosynthesis protein BcsQ